MHEQAYLSPSGEEAWGRLKTHLEWADSFALYFMFSRHARVIEIFRQRLFAMYPSQAATLAANAPETPEQLFSEILPILLNPSDQENAIHAPLWLDLSTQSDDAWRESRFQLLARLNEQREILRRNMHRPLVLILPADERQTIRRLAPDLWSIRDFTLDTLDDYLAGNAVQYIVDQLLEGTDVTVASPENRLYAIKEWERIASGPLSTKGAMIAAGRAFEAYFAERTFGKARETARFVREIAANISKGEETPEYLHGQALSCIYEGRVAEALGQLKEAYSLFNKSIEFRQRIIDSVCETPESLREFSSSLNFAGRIAMKLGRLKESFTLFSKSVALRRRILETSGDTQEALRDLSVSLSGAGRVALAIGNTAESIALFDENLALQRQILNLYGESPESARDFIGSLDDAGNLAEFVGRLAEAADFYRQSLVIVRNIIKKTGETPLLLDDLSKSLNNAGRIASKMGRLDEAVDLFRESLAISRRLIEIAGEYPESLYNLCFSLYYAGGAQLAIRDDAQAKVHLEKGLAIAHRLANEYPEQRKYGDLPALFEDTLASIPRA